MKEIKLELKGTYEEVVEFIRDNFDIKEPTIFTFTKIMKTNAKMRKLAKYKNVYEYEVESNIKLNDNNHKENLFKKVCVGAIGQGYVDFAKYGID